MDPQEMQRLQILEQTVQQILLQKQSFEMEISETDSAIEQVKASDEDVFKIIGHLMLKADKEKILSELDEKKKMLDARFKNLDSQQQKIEAELEKLKDILKKSEDKK